MYRQDRAGSESQLLPLKLKMDSDARTASPIYMVQEEPKDDPKNEPSELSAVVVLFLSYDRGFVPQGFPGLGF